MAKFSSEEELEKLEEDIRILKNKYDQFFAGISKYPPMRDRRMIEIFVHELSKQKIRGNARRFRLSTPLSRFNQLREMWARNMRDRQEGPLDFRPPQAAMSAQPDLSRPTPPPPPAPAPD